MTKHECKNSKNEINEPQNLNMEKYWKNYQCGFWKGSEILKHWITSVRGRRNKQKRLEMKEKCFRTWNISKMGK